MRRASFTSLLAVAIAAASCGSSGDDQSTATGAGAAAATSTSITTTTSAGGAATTSAATTSTTTTTGAGGSGGSGPHAVTAQSFLATLGVCTHVGQGIDDPAMSATAMAYAGIHNLRDDGDPGAVPGWIAMHQQAGIMTTFLTGGDLATVLDIGHQLAAAGALLAVEGPNEPNNFPVTYMGQTSDFNGSFQPVAAYQRDLYGAVKGDAALAGYPVFHSSEAGGSEPDDVGLQFLTIPSGAGIAVPDGTKYADYANTHNYVCGHQSMLVDNVSRNATDPTLNGDWDGMEVEYGHTWHGGFDGYADADLVTVPKVSTETGWVTQGGGAITEDQQGKVFMNLYLDAFTQGWSYTFIYMLRDDPNQGYWGLFDTSYAPKKSGEYMHNLTSILSSSSNDAQPLIGYSIASEPATVHDVLLAKGDGHYELVVWDEHPLSGSDDVTVTLDAPHPTVSIYDPTTGTAAVQTLSDVSHVPLTLTDHPMVIEFE